MNENDSEKSAELSRRNLMAESHLGLARRAACRAKRRLPSSIEFDDLYQSAALGLLQAANRYDPTRGTPFEQYAWKRVCGAAFNAFRGQRYRAHSALGHPSFNALVSRIAVFGRPGPFYP